MAVMVGRLSNMSHNKTKVSGQAPNSSSEINLSLEHLDDVQITSLSGDQILKYNGTSTKWENQPLSGGSASYIWVGGDYSNNYSNSPAGSGAISNGDTLYIYTNNEAVNEISGATITASNNWVQTIELPSGEYFLQGQTMFAFSASGLAAYRWETSTGTRLSQYGVVGESRGSTYGPSNSLAVGYINLAAATVIKLVLKASSNVDSGANQGTTPSQYGFIYIEKLS
jgi:hypothetical protein